MNFLGNIIWLIFGGLAMMVTIVGIPFGYQMIKVGSLALWICLLHLVFGVLLCVTIIGIPWGMQHFKLAGFALSPFGRQVDIVG